MGVFIGNENDLAKKTVAIFVGIDGKAKVCVNGYIGDENGIAQQIYTIQASPGWHFTCVGGVNLHVKGTDLAIDYGDGTIESIGTQTSDYLISHTYADPTTAYKCVLTGALSAVQFWASGDSEDAKTYLRKVNSAIPAGNTLANLNNIFKYCTSLTAVTGGLFENCTSVTRATSTFEYCSSLASIPAKLFAKNTELTTVTWTFRGSGITAIPAGLFDNCTKITNLQACFNGCAANTSIPAGLFDNCTKITNFNYAFASNAITSIPSALFDSCPDVTDFSYCFLSCTSVTGDVPELWDATKWASVSNSTACFRNCVIAANYADIPSGWR